MSIQPMLDAHPWETPVDRRALAACIEACLDCVATCTSCADACLAEDEVSTLRRCIRTDLDCADVCAATARLLARQTEWDPSAIREQLQACRQHAIVCAQDCESHAEHHEHCRICGETCRSCEQACDQLLSALS